MSLIVIFLIKKREGTEYLNAPPALFRLKVMAVRVLAVEVAILGSGLTSMDLFVVELFFTHRISPPPADKLPRR